MMHIYYFSEIREGGFLYSPSFREGVFSATGLPVCGFLGN